MFGKRSFWLLCLLSVWFSFFTTGAPAQLIEPTRSLENAAEAADLLNVLSELPGLEVHVDERLLGETPIFSARLPPRGLVLRIQDAEIDICLTAGKNTGISWFKGWFIAIPEKVNPPPEMTQEPQPTRPKPRADESPGVRQGAFNDPY